MNYIDYSMDVYLDRLSACLLLGVGGVRAAVVDLVVGRVGRGEVGL